MNIKAQHGRWALVEVYSGKWEIVNAETKQPEAEACLHFCADLQTGDPDARKAARFLLR